MSCRPSYYQFDCESPGALEKISSPFRVQALEKLKQLEPRKERSWSPTEVVAQRLSMAAAAAANAAAPLASNITSFTSAAASAVPMRAVTSQLQVGSIGS